MTGKNLMENINRYLEATFGHLGVEKERYGSCITVVVGHRDCVNFIFDKLDGSDSDATEMQQFLGDNPLFPYESGHTVIEALNKLDHKLGVLYFFEKDSTDLRWRATRKFDLRAEHDIESGEEQTYYDVDWNDVINDLKVNSPYYYGAAKRDASTRNRRDLHALLNFTYNDYLKASL